MDLLIEICQDSQHSRNWRSATTTLMFGDRVYVSARRQCLWYALGMALVLALPILGAFLNRCVKRLGWTRHTKST